MRTVESTVYQYDELSESAKDRAREWFREGMQSPDDFGADCVIEDATRMGAIIGINLKTRPVQLMGGGTRQEPNVYWSVGDRDAGASFAGRYSYRKGTIRELAAEAPVTWTDGRDGTRHESKGNAELARIAAVLQDVQRRNFYKLSASTNHEGRHFGMSVDVSRDDDKPMTADAEDTVTEALKDFAAWIFRQLEQEYDYRVSDEAVAEDIRANEYEFDEDGNRA